ncbi:hypothetical protein TCE0_033f09385 [Talaromyces pinophilus]|uniref:Uncharacterized protein n=1 Tax=Talaromyces pinophilus TaxID=128442 RepID=A0A6V8HDP9_TALPI|nr:hypothetical protein TCE0_033f09385 [Talaromyces pinophilus]
MPGELGGGVTAFFDGFHQMHCLNLVRQYTYRDQYVYSSQPAFDKSPEKLLSHIEHCIEMLRIDLMCFADDTPYLIKVEESGHESVEATTKHRCRNFEALIDWAKAYVVEPYNATAELIKHKDEHYDLGG